MSQPNSVYPPTGYVNHVEPGAPQTDILGRTLEPMGLCDLPPQTQEPGAVDSSAPVESTLPDAYAPAVNADPVGEVPADTPTGTDVAEVQEVQQNPA